MHFWIIYCLCLGLSVGSIQLAKANWQPPPVDIEESESSIIAIPPKPEGARDIVQGEGDEL